MTILSKNKSIDVKEMFPRLPRDGVFEAVRDLIRIVKEAISSTDKPINGKRLRVTQKGLIFSIHNHSKKLDRLGQAYSDEFLSLSESDVMKYVEFDIFTNDFFVVGSAVLRQLRGVAIGSVCAAQLADIYCLWRGLQFLQRCKHTLNRIFHTLPPRSIPIHPYRYMDNLVGAVQGRVGMKRVHEPLKRAFEKLYHLDLQIESEGLVLPSLSAVLSIDPVSCTVHLCMKPKVLWETPVHKRVRRYPDVQSVGCRISVRSIATQQGIDITWYSHHLTHVHSNTLMKELLSKKYPVSWWKPFLYRGMITQGKLSPTQASSILKFATSSLLPPTPPTICLDASLHSD